MMNQARGNGRKRRLGRRLNHTEGSPSKMRGCLIGDDRQIKNYDAIVARRAALLAGRQVTSMTISNQQSAIGSQDEGQEPENP
jgi:hypothetical protein